jgi:endonuclease/exonuclease/phosphatase family metal-dependent hydrolase
MTWSQIKPVVPPLVRIDHVLTGTAIAVTSIATMDGPGSDHRALLATVAIRP